MAASTCARPGGTVTSVMRTSAEAEGAFRFLENPRVEAEAIGDAVGMSTAEACDEHGVVFVAIDQTDLSFVDRKGIRGLGPDHTKTSRHRRGVQVMNALALDERGVPLGLLDQQWWCRKEERSPDFMVDKRPPQERESYFWVRTIDRCDARLAQAARRCRPWYIADRGCDGAEFLHQALDRNRLFTVRTAYNRVIQDSRGRKRKLYSTLARAPLLGTIGIDLPRAHNRRARRTRCEVRALEHVRIRLGRTYRTLSVVMVKETGHRGEPICWRLLTTAPVSSLVEANQVIRSYTFRWRVEEFHRTWKSGGCNVERSQLRSLKALRAWATILAAVSTRIERLKRLSRQTPDVSALTEVSQDEIDLAIAYTEDKRWKRGEQISLKEAVRLIAMVGGYMGRKGYGPPGSITIGRGLERLGPAVIALQNMKRSD